MLAMPVSLGHIASFPQLPVYGSLHESLFSQEKERLSFLLNASPWSILMARLSKFDATAYPLSENLILIL